MNIVSCRHPIVFASLFSLAALTGGCTVFQPFVPIPEPVRQPDERASAVEAALVRLDTVRSDLKGRANEQATIEAVAGVATFAGALGALAAGMYGGSRDMIVGFGLGGGTAYAAGSLAAPKGVGEAYRAGIEALNCVDAAGTPALQPWMAAATLSRVTDMVVTEVDRIERIFTPSIRIVELSTALTRTRAVVSTARIVAGSVIPLDREIGGHVHVAVSNVGAAVNNRVAIQKSDLEAISRMARSLGSFSFEGPPTGPGAEAAAGAATDAAARLAARAAGALSQPGATDTSAAQRAETALLADLRGQLEKAIEAYRNTVRITAEDVKSGVTACRIAELAATAGLSRQPSDKVQVEAGAPASFQISGGTAPYFATVLDSPPAGLQVDKASRDGIFNVRIDTAPATAKDVRIAVQDSSRPTAQTLADPVTLEIKAAAPSTPAAPSASRVPRR
ncbi:MAG: hypothetical protein AB7K86_16470 [Rhodospirillales bacterium]